MPPTLRLGGAYVSAAYRHLGVTRFEHHRDPGRVRRGGCERGLILGFGLWRGLMLDRFMALWFMTIALLGIWGISQHPSVLFAIDPRYGVRYLLSGGLAGFLVLGGVFLCVTGAEALYADMGHFGARPIRLAWSAIVFASLVLNYAGQAALVLEG